METKIVMINASSDSSEESGVNDDENDDNSWDHEDEVNEEYEESTEDINKVEDEGADVNVVSHFFRKERGTYTMTKTIMT